ncbi:hypothetical protein A3Q56_02665 [Intoshia linei]|uniref:Innexin n=1 Tax=Intoshia linei TaxID=1819745 RepID=A0A177B5P9_9BILA|nr:hypothetical protein A3Q56_02665 [Intoshia linei]
MVIKSIFRKVGKFFFLKNNKNCDKFDNLCFRVTPIFLFLSCMIVIFGKQFYISKLECWTPAEWTSSMNDFAMNDCWVRSTYFVPFEDSFPNQHKKIPRLQIILCTIGVFMYSTQFIWTYITHDIPIKISKMSKKPKTGLIRFNPQPTDKDYKDETGFCYSLLSKNNMQNLENKTFKCNFDSIKSILKSDKSAFHIYNYLKNKDKSKKYSIHLRHVFFKTLCMLAIIIQFGFLIWIFGLDYMDFGFTQIITLFRNTASTHNLFPKTTFCDIEIKRLGNNHVESMQCALPLNLLNEKIFLFYWFWCYFLLFVILIGIINTLFVCGKIETKKLYKSIFGDDVNNYQKKLDDCGLNDKDFNDRDYETYFNIYSILEEIKKK